MAFISLLLLLFSESSAKEALFSPKQGPHRIRYISSDSKITYYQKTTGGLALSTNYNVKVIIAGNPGDLFLVRGHSDLLLLEKYAQGLYTFSPESGEIYLAKLGADNLIKIGDGRDPLLHREGKFISYYDPTSRELVIFLQKNIASKTRIKVQAVSPLYLPGRALINDQTLLFTQKTNNGLEGLFSYNLENKKITPLRMAESISERFFICETRKKICLLSFLDNREHPFIKLSIIEPSGLEIKGVYQKEARILGPPLSLYEEDRLYLATTSSKGESTFALGLNEEKIEEMELSKLAFQKLSLIGPRVLGNHKGKAYLLDGNYDKKVDDL